MPNTLGSSKPMNGTAQAANGIFPAVAAGGTFFGTIRDSLSNGITTLIDGVVQRELGVENNTAGFAPVSDNRTERVAPSDTAPRSVIPFVDLTDKNIQLAAGGVVVAAILAFIVFKR